jgi:hypothetical protein
MNQHVLVALFSADSWLMVVSGHYDVGKMMVFKLFPHISCEYIESFPNSGVKG